MTELGIMKNHKAKGKNDQNTLSESMEDYIEAISQLEEKLKVVRVKNIAKIMKVKMPSVSSALGVLYRKGLVKYEKYDYVELTDTGQRVANSVRRRHDTLKKFLMEVLAVDERNAEKDSCGMEHHISKNTIYNIVRFMEFIDLCPKKNDVCLKNFSTFMKTGVVPQCAGED